VQHHKKKELGAVLESGKVRKRRTETLKENIKGLEGNLSPI